MQLVEPFLEEQWIVDGVQSRPRESGQVVK